MAWLVALSLLLQVSAAVLALRLIRITGWKLAWVLLSATCLSLTARRGMSFVHALRGDGVRLDREEELATLAASGLMLGSVVSVGHVFEALDDEHKRRVAAELERVAFERRLVESQRLESLGMLAGGIAHDFRNILTVVIGNANLLETEAEPDSEVARVAKRIEHYALKASDFANQLRVYAGRRQEAPVLRDLNELVSDMEDLLSAALRSGVRLEVQVDPAALTVRCAPIELTQVLLNLVLNANDALETCGGLVQVTTQTRELDASWMRGAESSSLTPGAYALLSVSDDGAGMDEVTRARLFEPSFSTKGADRGLGLSAVFGIVRKHGGTIRVESQPGRGARFEVALPLCATGQPETTASA